MEITPWNQLKRKSCSLCCCFFHYLFNICFSTLFNKAWPLPLMLYYGWKHLLHKNVPSAKDVPFASMYQVLSLLQKCHVEKTVILVWDIERQKGVKSYGEGLSMFFYTSHHVVQSKLFYLKKWALLAKPDSSSLAAKLRTACQCHNIKCLLIAEVKSAEIFSTS